MSAAAVGDRDEAIQYAHQAYLIPQLTTMGKHWQEREVPVATASQFPSSPKSMQDFDELLLGRRASLNPMFHPKAVAVLGPVERAGTVAQKVLTMLLSGPLAKAVFPIHPHQERILGIRSYPQLSAVPAVVDLAVIATPAEMVPEAIGACVHAGVKGTIVLSSGFSKCGGAGRQLEAQICENLRGSRMRVLGPSCLGVINAVTEFNATPGLPMPMGGSVAFITESGALAMAILDWSLKAIVGLSAFVSVGTMLDVGWGDLIDYFGNDPRTQTILLCMESVGNIRSFLSAAREVSLNKPILVLKAGRSEAAIRATGWRSNDITDDEALQAAFRRVGVLQVDDIGDLFYTADALSKQPRPNGPRLMVVSNAIGAGELAADGVIASGAELGTLSLQSREDFDKVLAPNASKDASGDVLGEGSPEKYLEAVQIAAKDSNCDGVLLAAVPLAFSNPRRATELLLTLPEAGKPILASFMGGESATAEEIVMRACIPVFPCAHTAARVFNYMWRYSYNLGGLYETPILHADVTEAALRQLAASTIQNARDAARTVLTEMECRTLLAAYGISTVHGRSAHGEEEAVRIAREIGFPVVVKASEHTAEEIDLEPIDLVDEAAVRRAWRFMAERVTKGGEAGHAAMVLRPAIKINGYELMVTSRTDPQFGPVLVFAAGGKLANVFRDRAVGLPPLNATLARRMMEQTRIYSALQRNDGRSRLDLGGLESLLVRMSQLVVEQPSINEIQLKLFVSPEQLLGVDAHVTIHDAGSVDMLPTPAIRPYPVNYVSPWIMKDGQAITIRPIRPEDEPLMVKFHERLSDRSVYLRYFQGVALHQRTTHDRLTRICFIDYDREIALIAERRDPQTQERQIIALGNLTKMHRGNDAEVAAITSDEYHGRGLGSEMMRRLLRVARDENIERVLATTLPENQQMCAMLKRLGFQVTINLDDNLVEAELAFGSAGKN